MFYNEASLYKIISLFKFESGNKPMGNDSFWSTKERLQTKNKCCQFLWVYSFYVHFITKYEITIITINLNFDHFHFVL